MKIQMMKSGTVQVFRFLGRLSCIFLMITSTLHFGQSFSAENAAIHIQEETVIAASYLPSVGKPETDNGNIPEAAVITGKEHLYIVSGAVVYVESKSSGSPVKKAKRQRSVSAPQKAISKKKERKDTHRNYPAAQTRFCTAFPEGSNVQHVSLSGQIACTGPGSYDRNFIFLQEIRYLSTAQYDEYIRQNYTFHFSLFSANNINGGGIRPPPFHC